ncbi:MAG TPA: DUF2071 domain-containing protein [Gaiellaceae bacterium]|nr:DUF2071 domain-containing protein [Gaiellaceae bacterium]
MFEQVRAAGRQGRLVERVDGRPWPLPEGRWMVGQTLEDVFLAHWRAAPEAVQALLPAGVEADLHDGSAWIGVLGFRVSALRSRGLLPVPGLSSFLQLNVRTYVRGRDEKPGIWFFSLDASSRFAVEGGRRRFGVPFFHARLAIDRVGDWCDVECARIGERGRVFSGRYRAAGDAFAPAAGSLEAFLVERYCLYSSDRHGRLHRAEIHHEPWSLRKAQAEIELASIAPLALDGTALCHASERQDILAWPLELLDPSK